jgi:hypothetical protein
MRGLVHSGATDSRDRNSNNSGRRKTPRAQNLGRQLVLVGTAHVGLGILLHWSLIPESVERALSDSTLIWDLLAPALRVSYWRYDPLLLATFELLFFGGLIMFWGLTFLSPDPALSAGQQRRALLVLLTSILAMLCVPWAVFWAAGLFAAIFVFRERGSSAD